MNITVSEAIAEATAQKKEKVTLEQFGKALGVSKQYIGQIKTKFLSKEQIAKIESSLNVCLTKVNKEDCTNLPIKGNVSASMGYGLTIYDENKTGTYAISNKLAKDIGADLSKSDIIFAKGDSMEPTIMGGDSLLVDRSKTEVYDGRIYCIRYEGELYAKRLQKLPPKKIKVVSDNQNKYDAWYVDFEQTPDFDFEIVGEVLWWGRVAR